MIPNKKSSILLVLRTLEEYSDEEHYLTHKEIINLINQDYGIELERKSIASSLSLLDDLDYDIDKNPKGGFALLSRVFDETEASFLIDAIFSSKSINGNQAKKLSECVSKCFSKYQRQDYSYICKSTEVNRTNNKEVLYNISIIHEAIKKGKRISFQCLTYDEDGNKVFRKDGKEYIVSPYYLVNNFGRYYLIGNQSEKYNDILAYRMDHLTNIKVREDLKLRRLNELKEQYKDFNITKYLNEHIYLFGGDTVEARLEILQPNAVSYIKDWFGENIKIQKKNNKLFVDITCNKKALYYWVLQYGGEIKVISPTSFVKEIKEGLSNILKNYK